MAGGTVARISKGLVPLGPSSANSNTPCTNVNMPKCTTKNGTASSFVAQYAGSRGCARSNLATLNAPTTTFSSQYNSTRGKTFQPSNTTPAIGTAFARPRTRSDGVTVTAGAPASR